MVETPRLRVMLYVFSLVKGIQELEYFFPHIVNLTSSMVQYLTMGLETRRLKNPTNSDRHKTSARKLA